MAKSRCPQCGKILPIADAKACPYCGAILDESLMEPKKENTGKPMTEEEMLEQVRAHIDNLDKSRVEPNLRNIIIGALVIVFAFAAFFTNGFGMFMRQSTNPIAVYFDSMHNLLASDSARFTQTFTDYTSGEPVVTVTEGYFISGTASKEAVIVTNGASVSDMSQIAYWALYSDFFTVGNGQFLLETPDKSRMYTKKGYNFDYLYELTSRSVKARLAETGVVMNDKALDQFVRISQKYMWKALESRSYFDQVFLKYSKTKDNGISTYTFKFSIEGYFEQYRAYLAGAGTASAWSDMKKAFNAYAVTVDPEYFWEDGYKLLFDEWAAMAKAYPNIFVVFSVDNDRNLQNCTVTVCDVLENPIYKYELAVSDINSVDTAG